MLFPYLLHLLKRWLTTVGVTNPHSSNRVVWLLWFVFLGWLFIPGWIRVIHMGEGRGSCVPALQAGRRCTDTRNYRCLVCNAALFWIILDCRKESKLVPKLSEVSRNSSENNTMIILDCNIILILTHLSHLNHIVEGALAALVYCKKIISVRAKS